MLVSLPSPMIDYSRNQLTFIVTLSTEYAAQKFELLLQHYTEATPPQQKQKPQNDDSA